MKHLILGGMRSGKSALAEKLARQSEMSVTYLATATAGDKEMTDRIRAHQSRRPAHWQLIEEPCHLAQSLRKTACEGHCILVDCLTLWITNLLLNKDPGLLAMERNELLACVPDLKGEIIFVSNETNMGLVPMEALSRRFCDEAGSLHQEMAQIVERVTLVTAGLAQTLKGEPI